MDSSGLQRQREADFGRSWGPCAGGRRSTDFHRQYVAGGPWAQWDQPTAAYRALTLADPHVGPKLLPPAAFCRMCGHLPGTGNGRLWTGFTPRGDHSLDVSHGQGAGPARHAGKPLSPAHSPTKLHSPTQPQNGPSLTPVCVRAGDLGSRYWRRGWLQGCYQHPPGMGHCCC